MDKRKAKRINAKNKQEERYCALFNDIAQSINSGGDLNDLKSTYKQTILNAAFSRFSQQNYALIERIYGPAASTHKILIDECVDPALLSTTHQNLGVTTLSSLSFSKNTQDQELFSKAQDQGFRAIISSDYISAGARDLCGIANASYARAERAPHIIIVPQGVENAVNALEKHASALQALLVQEKPNAIYMTMK